MPWQLDKFPVDVQIPDWHNDPLPFVHWLRGDGKIDCGVEYDGVPVSENLEEITCPQCNAALGKVREMLNKAAQRINQSMTDEQREVYSGIADTIESGWTKEEIVLTGTRTDNTDWEAIEKELAGDAPPTAPPPPTAAAVKTPNAPLSHQLWMLAHGQLEQSELVAFLRERADPRAERVAMEGRTKLRDEKSGDEVKQNTVENILCLFPECYHAPSGRWLVWDPKRKVNQLSDYGGPPKG